jgi:hypothetical protein
MTFEGPFIYLLFGTNKAILFDSGARPESPSAPARRAVQNELIYPQLASEISRRERSFQGWAWP